MTADYLNILFILISGAIAYFVPFELMIFSYAFLGPAHYLTQISWLHQRGYFLGKKWDVLPLILITTVMIFFPNHYVYFMTGSLVLALSLFFIQNNLLRLVLTVALSFAVISYQVWTGPITFIFFLPTLVHVFFFTFTFILYGAIQRKSIPAYTSLVLLLLMGMSFFVFTNMPSMYRPEDFHHGKISFIRYEVEKILHLTRMESSWPFLVGICRFISFAYTYHYLNWFSKTETIGWHRLSSRTFIILGAIYLALISIYIHDFKTGVRYLAWLSLLHVILELPLNARTAKLLIQKPFSSGE